MASLPRPGIAAAGLFVGPAVWAIHQQTTYVLVPVSCTARMLVIPFVTIVALAIIIGGAWLSAAGRQKPSTDTEAIPDPRLRTAAFLSTISLLASAVFFMAVLLQGAASLILGSCQR